MRSIVLPALLLSTSVLAQPVQIAEEFTNETILWRLGLAGANVLSDVPEGTGALPTDTSLQLTVVGLESSGEQELFFEAPFGQAEPVAASIFKATIQPDITSNIAETGTLRMRIVHHFYNRLAENGFPDREGGSRREGDVRMSLDLKFNEAGSSAGMCLNSRNAEGRLEPYQIFEDDTTQCQSFTTQPILGEMYQLEMFFNAAEDLMGVALDDERLEFSIPDAVTYRANSNQPYIEASTEANGDRAVLNIIAVETDTFLDDYMVDGAPVVFFDLDDERNTILRTGGSQRPMAVNGELLMAVSSTDGDTEQSRLNIDGDTDYLEAQLQLSSETSFEATSSDSDAQALVRLSGSQYDINIDGGLDETGVGVAWARVDLLMDANLTTSARYCFQVFTSDAPEFLSTPLLASGEECNNFQTIPELDTYYTSSIVTDRDNLTVTFTFGDEVVVHDIQESEIFQPGVNRQFNAVRSRMSGSIGKVVGYADNIRTDPNVLFSTESIASETTGSSGGGCSIGGDRSNLSNLLLLLFAISGIGYRRMRRPSK